MKIETKYDVGDVLLTVNGNVFKVNYIKVYNIDDLYYVNCAHEYVSETNIKCKMIPEKLE